LQIPLLSLPGVFRTTLDTVPAEVPYLFPSPELVEKWRPRLAAIGGFRIGIVWQGSAQYRGDRQRSIALAEFAPLARLPGVRLISLQKGFGTEQLGALPCVESLGEEYDGGPHAFLDSAAVMESLDLVITLDSALAHLAGALGRPVWVALKQVPDWRWFLERSDSVWYPSMRLFRQESEGDWVSVFAKMEAEIRK
jgi:hypothetical protein